MNIHYSLTLVTLVPLAALTACGSSGGADNPGDASDGPLAASQVDDALIPSADDLLAAMRERESLDSAYMPTGSDAQRAYVDSLEAELGETCATDVHREPFTYDEWTAQTVSLTVDGQSVEVQAPVQASGSTGAAGIQAQVVRLDTLTAQVFDLMLDGQPIADRIGSYDVAGKIVAVRVPLPFVPVDALSPYFYSENDPDSLLSGNMPRTLFTALLAAPTLEAVLTQAGAVGMVIILPFNDPALTRMHGPLGVEASLPSVYVDDEAGAALTSGTTAELVLDATTETATFDNLIATVPGRADREVALSTHTDATNAIEDDGPIAAIAAVRYLCSVDRDVRPVTLRVVLHGGHLVGNPGLRTYVAAHEEELAGLVGAIEVEHLGALAYDPDANGGYALTGQAEPMFVSVSSSNALHIAEAEAFAEVQAPSIALPRAVLPFGAGDEWTGVTTLIQLISGPNYLLSFHVPDHAVTESFTDTGLMHRQIAGVVQMLLDLGNQ